MTWILCQQASIDIFNEDLESLKRVKGTNGSKTTVHPLMNAWVAFRDWTPSIFFRSFLQGNFTAFSNFTAFCHHFVPLQADAVMCHLKTVLCKLKTKPIQCHENQADSISLCHHSQIQSSYEIEAFDLAPLLRNTQGGVCVQFTLYSYSCQLSQLLLAKCSLLFLR